MYICQVVVYVYVCGKTSMKPFLPVNCKTQVADDIFKNHNFLIKAEQNEGIKEYSWKLDISIFQTHRLTLHNMQSIWLLMESGMAGPNFSPVCVIMRVASARMGDHQHHQCETDLTSHRTSHT